MAESLSVVIITLNAERHLVTCLRSVAFADELLVVDAGSSDNTEEIAKQFGARFIQQDWLGYGKQKNFAAEQARHRWILSIDADESVSDDLRRSIDSCLQRPSHKAYAFARRNCFMGRWLKHGEGYPDISLRLFNKEFAKWSEDPIHEKVVTDETVGRLIGDLMHHSENGIADYLTKQNHYTTLQAQQLFAKGKRAMVARMLLSPVFRFIKFYLLRLGFLDGLPGLIHISIGCFNSFTKYAKLIALTTQKKHS